MFQEQIAVIVDLLNSIQFGFIAFLLELGGRAAKFFQLLGAILLRIERRLPPRLRTLRRPELSGQIENLRFGKRLLWFE